MSESSDFEYLVFVKYLDHVLYNRASALAMQPQVRQAVGWLVYECDRYLTIAWDYDADPPTLRGGDPKASGMVLLKSDMLELQRVPTADLPLQKSLERHLNSLPTTIKSEYALPAKEAKNSPREKEK